MSGTPQNRSVSTFLRSQGKLSSKTKVNSEVHNTALDSTTSAIEVEVDVHPETAPSAVVNIPVIPTPPEPTEMATKGPEVKVKSFAGTPGCKASKWFERYSQLCKHMYGWNENKVKNTFQFHLVDQALAWYESLPDTVQQDPDQLLPAFQDRFDGSDAGFSVSSLKQRPTETVWDYTTRFLQQTNDKGMPETWLVSNFVDGLYPSMRNMVKPQCLPTLNEARQAAIRAEQTVNDTIEVSSIHAGNSDDKINKLSDMMTQLCDTLKQLKPEQPHPPQQDRPNWSRRRHMHNQELYASDDFFREWLKTVERCDLSERAAHISQEESAEEFYVIVGSKVYEDFIDPEARAQRYTSLKTDCCRALPHHGKFSCLSSKYIRYVECYEERYASVVKTCVTINEDFCTTIAVHGKLLPKDHSIWEHLPSVCLTTEHVEIILSEISKYIVCCGNPDPQYQGLVPVGGYLDVANETNRAGYQEYIGTPTVRGSKCCLLIQKGRCKSCILYRRTLSKAVWRKKERVATPKQNWIVSKKANSQLSVSQKDMKLKQMRQYVSSLESEVEKLKRKLRKSINDSGVKLTESDNEFMESMIDEADRDIKDSFPDDVSVQRLFWEQQKKAAQLTNKKGMRWHPMLIKWCIYLKSKSSTTYDAMRKSGFIHLPSERTLHDYSSVLSNGVGFHDDVTVHLQEQVKNFEKDHQKIVGILQDEVRIKSDLVYNKNSGELVGFVDLDNVGNDLMHIKDSLDNSKKTLAKYVLVVMVQGISTRLRYPIAHFATNGVVSDQLFSILWEAVEILEIDVDLTVLFITSDGASPNRRFIRLHGDGDHGVVYRADNIFASEQRFIYFISDPPHLIKTIRNNFSNSFSHKNSKKLWKNGQDISWKHIAKLYFEHCSGLYRLCPKLSRKHVCLESFNYMKVNLAAQVMSSTVANALELTRGDEVSETVKFIRHVDKFFDILNTRNLNESRNKRNENLKPFTSSDDQRLEYLEHEFLAYFEDWEEQVENRQGNFSKTDKNAMKMSYQTLEGIRITVKSVIECIKFCLSHEMDFVLTERFNQDGIEQHFGMHRANCGSNTNPSLQQFNFSLQKLRTVGSTAIAPLRGNTKRNIELKVDNTPMNKKKRHTKSV